MPDPTFDDIVNIGFHTTKMLERTSRAMLYCGTAMLITAMVEQQARNVLGEKQPVNLLDALVGGMLFGAAVSAWGNVHPDAEPLSASFKLALFYVGATYVVLNGGGMTNIMIFDQYTGMKPDSMLRTGLALAYPCYQLHRSLPAIGEFLDVQAEKLLAYLNPGNATRHDRAALPA